MTANLDEGIWSDIGWIELNDATCALGDAVVVDPTFWLDSSPPADFYAWVPDGLPLVACSTLANESFAVEKMTDVDGLTIAVRIEFLTDRSWIDGAWVPCGQLELLSGTGVACDPFSNDKGPPYRFEFPLTAGCYEAQYFVTEDDVLGLRIVRASLPGDEGLKIRRADPSSKRPHV